MECSTHAIGPDRRLELYWLRVSGAIWLALLAADVDALFIVNQPWVRPARVAQTTQAYMNLTSTEGATLVGARSRAARHISLRSGRSTRSAALSLPANAEVALLPGHDHLTLAALTRTLSVGDRLEII